MKYAIWLGVAVAAIAVAMWIYGEMSSGAPVDVAVASVGTIREFVEERGETRLPRVTLITMPYNGRIEAIDLAEGEPVTKDQVVARVAPIDLELQRAQAQAAVDRLEASIKENDDATVELTALEQSLKFVESMASTVQAAEKRVEAGEAKLDFANKRQSRLRDTEQRARGSVSAEELDQAELNQVQSRVDYQQDVLVLNALRSMQAATVLVPTLVRQYIDRKKLARAVLEEEQEQAIAKLKQTQHDLERGVMASPIDGVVLERVESNERQVAAGTILLRIGALGDLEVEADLLSEDVVDVAPNDPVEVFGAVVGSEPAHGSVRRIYPAGFTKVSSLGVEQQRVKVVVQLTPESLQRLREQRDLGVGYRVRVRIITDEHSGAVIVPRSALFRGPAGDWRLFAAADGAAELRTVKVGLMNDHQVEITSGLAADEQVILAPETHLSDGDSVHAVTVASAPAP